MCGPRVSTGGPGKDTAQDRLSWKMEHVPQPPPSQSRGRKHTAEHHYRHTEAPAVGSPKGCREPDSQPCERMHWGPRLPPEHRRHPRNAEDLLGMQATHPERRRPTRNAGDPPGMQVATEESEPYDTLRVIHTKSQPCTPPREINSNPHTEFLLCT